jgi:hypothetical protein
MHNIAQNHGGQGPPPYTEREIRRTADRLSADAGVGQDAAEHFLQLIHTDPFADLSVAQTMILPDIDKRKRIVELIQSLQHQAALRLIDAQTARALLFIGYAFQPNTDQPLHRQQLVDSLRDVRDLIHRALRLADDYLNKPPMRRVARRISNHLGDCVQAWDEAVQSDPFDGVLPGDIGTDRPQQGGGAL